MKKIVMARSRIVHSITLTALAVGIGAAGLVHAQGGMTRPPGQESMPGQGGMQGGGAIIPGTQDPDAGTQRYQDKGDRLKKGSDMDGRGSSVGPGYGSGSDSGSGSGSGVGGGTGSGVGGGSGSGAGGGAGGGGGGG